MVCTEYFVIYKVFICLWVKLCNFFSNFIYLFACFQTKTFKLWYWKRLEIPLDCKGIKPVNPKGNQLWMFIRRTDTEAEAPRLWPPDAKSRLIGKDPDAWKNWGQEEKRVGKDEMVVWHHWLNGHEFEETPGNGEGRGRLVCFSPWGGKESDMI